MRKKIVLCVKIVVFALCCVAVERFCHKQTKGFTLLKIASHSPASAGNELDLWPEDKRAALDATLNQSFSFLNSGGQCYAFLSEDGQTVLKFFKQHHLRAWQWIHSLPLPRLFHSYRTALLGKKIHHSPQFLESCRIAYEEFKDRTGLIYLHLHKTTCFKKKVKIIDRLGIAHWIDLDTTDFALQHKVELSHAHLRRLIKKNSIEEAKDSIDSILSLIQERCNRGIADRDPNMRRNIGFLDNRAVEIDLGSFTKCDTLCDKEELIEKTEKLHNWLLKRNEELASYLEMRCRESSARKEVF